MTSKWVFRFQVTSLRNHVTAVVGMVLALQLGAAEKVIRSPEFCFEASFAGVPQEEDVSRLTTDQKIPIRARNFTFSDRRGAVIVTAVKFDKSRLLDEYVPTYFDSAIRSYARKVNGKVIKTAATTFEGMPARSFEVEWKQDGEDWRSRNVITYRNGRSYTFGATYRPEEGISPQGRNFLRTFHVDAACLGR